jgi:kinesin family protein 3/17
LEGGVAYQKAIVRTNQGKTCVASESVERTLGRRMMMGDIVSDGGDVRMSGSMLEDGDFDSASTRFKSHEFGFDAVYDETSTQEEVYERSAKPAVLNALRGYNATVLAYGQTGTGKTYTMEGERAALLAYGQQRYGLPGNAPPTDAEERGIIPRAIEDIFDFIASDSNARSKYLVRVSYLQIYNETISDLLKPERVNLTIREDKKRGVFVEGQSEWVARTPQEIYSLLERGAQLRATGATKMNEISSRSHAVFTIIIEHSKIDDDEPVDAIDSGATTRAQRQSITVGKLNLVDLAGSERVSLTGATGKRLDESKKINQSLSALGNVISALTDVKGRPHIPYRDSKLTRILEDSLGGNCITTVIAMVSPALEAYAESLSTLKFANRAKEIKNKAKAQRGFGSKIPLAQVRERASTVAIRAR